MFELFLWTKPKSLKTFDLKSKEFAANQGIYNGFLAAGLIFALIEKNIHFAFFFLICATIAGIYGSYSTKSIRLFFLQGLPAILALIILINNKTNI